MRWPPIRSPARAWTCSTGSRSRPITRCATMENAVLMPHLGYVTESGFRFAFGRMAEDVAAFLRGDPIRVVE